jgi:hypothetical protein
MHLLNDDQLINCYFEALELKLDDTFIHLILNEINKRNLNSALDYNTKLNV